MQRIDTDGNCQWKSLSWACFGDTTHHAQIRSRVCKEIQNNWSHYKYFVTNSDTYVQKMQMLGTWGDHCTLTAFCNVYNQHVLLLRVNDTPVLIAPSNAADRHVKANEWLVLVYDRSAMHYCSVTPYYSSPTSSYLREVQSKHST